MDRRAIIHFIDNTTLTLEWPKQERQGFALFSEAVRSAIEAPQLLVEIEGSFLIVQMKNVKFIEISPPPDQLPAETFRKAQRVA